MKITGKSLFLALGMILGLLGLFGAIQISIPIYIIVIGYVLTILSDLGLTLPDALNDTLNLQANESAAGFTAINSGVSIVIALIPLVVILLVFGAFIYQGYQKMKSKKSKGSGGPV